ncbi:hypothetical protein [Paenarthrobacter ureafaciens]|uniref:hypothetical protein n=1 Tax=Paenarthrobacter ureafaciens TaxID=37931 RepID=UPI002DB9F163|nr:hypothetical protein [Paenarthrobacter ureafaciens]MEC3853464.1 hypothetical protein [Paenarthrobacter ureafaciens]
MPAIKSVRSARASLAVSARWGHSDLPERRRDLEAAKLAAHIEAVVATAPLPSPEQAQELARLLTPIMLGAKAGA